VHWLLAPLVAASLFRLPPLAALFPFTGLVGLGGGWIMDRQFPWAC